MNPKDKFFSVSDLAQIIFEYNPVRIILTRLQMSQLRQAFTYLEWRGMEIRRDGWYGVGYLGVDVITADPAPLGCDEVDITSGSPVVKGVRS